MLSAIVLAPPYSGSGGPAVQAVVRTLGALVPGTVEGLVRDVTLVSGTPDEGIRTVVDHAGCKLVEGTPFRKAFDEALAQARQPNVLVIRAGAGLDRGFIDEVAALLGPDHVTGELRTAVLRQVPEGLAARLLPELAPVAGLIAPKARFRSPEDFAALVRQAGKGRTMAARAIMAA